eukprot:COSAG01_NODE_6325_length_3734_cov_3.565062_4_plen_104_part_00
MVALAIDQQQQQQQQQLTERCSMQLLNMTAQPAGTGTGTTRSAGAYLATFSASAPVSQPASHSRSRRPPSPPSPPITLSECVAVRPGREGVCMAINNCAHPPR